MLERTDMPSIERAIIREMALTGENVERRQRFVGLTPEDLSRIASIKSFVLQRLEQLADGFFSYLGELEEGRRLFSHRDLFERIRTLKMEHLAAMVSGDYGQRYVEERVKLGVLYNKADLDVRVFMGGFNHLLKSMGDVIMASSHAPAEAFAAYMSLQKVAFFDLAIIVDVIVSERERVIRRQQDAIRELSTPVLQIRERMLLLPIIGVIDSYRAQLITESLLRSIRANRARVVVVDVTGVASIDSRVANHLMQTVAAARLMGATAIVTGLSPEVAQSLVALGIDLASFNTLGDLQGGVEEAERLLGYHVVEGRADNAALD